MKIGVKELATKHKDDYNKVLSVFQYGTKEDAQTVNPHMDRAIKKATIVIQKHSIYIKRKEHVRWIDDSYLLMGKAYFYKQEFRQALRTFDFIIQQYRKNPIKYDAMLWIARTKNVQGKFDEAQSLLDEIQNKIEKKKAASSLEKELAVVYADYYIRQHNYSPAIEYLQKAIRLNNKKSIKNRLRYILAQIYQRNGYLQQASELYKKVIKKNPPYEMSFNAKINLAKCFDATSGDSKLIKKKLNKMLKDEKNLEYLDQIYYALAEVALKEKDEEQCIKYLRLSVSTSYANDYQKTTSSLKLAEMYFSKPDYVNAKAYYDTSMTSLPLNYPNYSDIERTTKTLSELVTNILVINREDSLQKLGRMDPKELDAVINKIIEKIVKEEQEKRQQCFSNFVI